MTTLHINRSQNDRTQCGASIFSNFANGYNIVQAADDPLGSNYFSGSAFFRFDSSDQLYLSIYLPVFNN